MEIPIGVTARNEARTILGLLDSLRTAIANAEAAFEGIRFRIYIILNDNSDETESLLMGQPDLTMLHTHGGIIEAQRALVLTTSAPFVIFSDADIQVGCSALFSMVRAMLEDSQLVVAYAHKVPVEPLRNTPLARALYLYNLREGYQTTRHYFNGQFFAIRHWHIPPVSELRWNPSDDNLFLNLSAGIRCDDIYLSRTLLASRGPQAVRCLDEARVFYRPPETLRGMYRKYQRMVLEIERLHAYFPETRPAHEQWGQRRLDRSRLREAPLRERLYYVLFQLALVLCKLAYAGERYYYTHFSRTPCPTWLPVEESKEPLR